MNEPTPSWPPPQRPIPAPGSRTYAEFDEVLFSRRSVRRFKPDPVPEPVVRRLLEAARWAPSSCNLQLWDFVVVTDPALRERVAVETKFVMNSPLAIFVLYEKGHSEENWADVQSAACAGQNMQLMAYTQGLGSFWVLNLGNKRNLAAILGIPESKEIIAMLLFGYPAHGRAASRRRPIEEIVHWNGYRGGRELPTSQRPRDWTLDAIRDYQRRKVVSGIRYNKPLPWEYEPVLEAARAIAPRLPAKARWLDVLPCTGLYTEAFASVFGGADLTILELDEEVAAFAAGRTGRCPRVVLYAGDGRVAPAGGVESGDPGGRDEGNEGVSAIAAGTYDLVTCTFRLEGLPPQEVVPLVDLAARAVAPGGWLLWTAVSRRSYHTPFQIVRRWLGTRQVGFALAPDPSVGPFEPIAIDPVAARLRAAGLRRIDERRLHALPPPEELTFRLRNRGPVVRAAMTPVRGLLSIGAALANRLPRWARLVLGTWQRPPA